jgi:branched-chain amino acid transport system permease protein
MEIFIQTLFTGLLTGGLYALIGIGLNMVLGVMRVANFAHGAMVMIAMYITWIIFSRAGIDPFVALPITMFLMFLLGVGFQVLIVNHIIDAPHFNQILLTEGAGIVLVNVMLLLFTANDQLINPVGVIHDGVLRIGGVGLDYKRMFAFAIAVIITGALFWFLARTDLGKSIRATAQDREAARLMGIDVSRVSALTMGIGVALAGAAGALLVPIYQRVDPFIGARFMSTAFSVVVLGGLGSIQGATLGGLVIGVVEAIAGVYNPAFLGGGGNAGIYTYLLFLLVLLIKPNGLFGSARL